MSRLVCAAIILLTPVLSWAHHGSAAIYKLDESTTVEGTVTEVRFVYPHARVYFQVVGEDGNAELWMAEGANPAVLRHRGWRGEELQPGDRIRATGAPARNGSPKIEWSSITLPDGTEVGGGNRFPFERSQDELLERLDRQRRESDSSSP
jgi:hypothetical protein